MVIMAFDGGNYSLVEYGSTKADCEKLKSWIDMLGGKLDKEQIESPWDMEREKIAEASSS